MRKGITETNKTNIPVTSEILNEMADKGFKYVQVKGLTIDKHYDYVGPHFLVLVPMKELPVAQENKDIYEPIQSELLHKWAKEKDEFMEIVISRESNN